MLLLGCGPIVRQAPFGMRPDSVKPGSLVGPFEGRVVDADTDKPIADAVVWCSWSFHRGVGNTAPEAVRSRETRTDADGRYRVEALRTFPQGMSTRLARFSLVVYKKDYVAYRHDAVFNRRARRPRFSQLNNQIELSKWSPELSHADHLLFIGNAAPLAEASKWEVVAAVAELEGRRSRRPLTTTVGMPSVPRQAKRPLDASVLLSSDDVRAVTGFVGRFEAGRLAGGSSATYDTFHLRAVDKPERYDVAIRLWRLSDDALTAQYEEILNKLPGSKQTDEIADRSFTVQQGEILGIGFMDRTAGAFVLLTCGKGQCSKPSHLPDLAAKVEKNLSRLPRSGVELPEIPEERPLAPKAPLTPEESDLDE